MAFSFAIYLFLCPQVCYLPCLLPQQLNLHLWHRGRSQLDYWRVHIHILKKNQNRSNQNHTCNVFALHRAHLRRSGLILYHFSITLLPENFTAFLKCYFTAVDEQDLGDVESRVPKEFQSCLITHFRWGGISNLLLPQLSMDNSCLLPRAVQPHSTLKDKQFLSRGSWMSAQQPQIFLLEGQPWSQGWGRAVEEQLLLIQF